MVKKVQDNERTLEKAIKEKLSLSDKEEIENYHKAIELASKCLPITGEYSSFSFTDRKGHVESNLLKDQIIISVFKEYNLSYPFLIQSSLVDDILSRNVKGQIPIEERFKEELTSYIKQLDGSYVQSMYSKLMNKNLQKKLIKVNKATRVGNHILNVSTYGMIAGVMVSLLLFDITNEAMLLIIGFPCSISILLLGMLLLYAVDSYMLHQKNAAHNELKNITEELNSDYKNNHELKSDVEGNTRTEQQEQGLTGSNSEKDASNGDLTEATTTPQVQNSPECSPSPQ